ncbi:hypothetical protein C8J57DRAFT_1579193, partial [Mycena rebaudengoi]
HGTASSSGCRVGWRFLTRLVPPATDTPRFARAYAPRFARNTPVYSPSQRPRRVFYSLRPRRPIVRISRLRSPMSAGPARSPLSPAARRSRGCGRADARGGCGELRVLGDACVRAPAGLVDACRRPARCFLLLRRYRGCRLADRTSAPSPRAPSAASR